MLLPPPALVYAYIGTKLQAADLLGSGTRQLEVVFGGRSIAAQPALKCLGGPPCFNWLYKWWLASQLKCCWRTETKREVGYKKGRETDQGARTSKRSGGEPHQKPSETCRFAELV